MDKAGEHVLHRHSHVARRQCHWQINNKRNYTFMGTTGFEPSRDDTLKGVEKRRKNDLRNERNWNGKQLNKSLCKISDEMGRSHGKDDSSKFVNDGRNTKPLRTRKVVAELEGLPAEGHE